MTALIEPQVAPVSTKSYTLAEFMALPNDGRRYELKNGELIEMRGPSVAHAQIIATLSHYLRGFVEASGANQANGLGQILADCAFVFDPLNAPNSAYRSDVAFVTQARFAAVGDYDDAFPGVPDLAIEIVSRTDYLYGVSEKIEDYLQAKVRLIWVINPRRSEVFVYEPGQHARLLEAEDELDGGEVLPGFKLKLSEIFKHLKR